MNQTARLRGGSRYAATSLTGDRETGGGSCTEFCIDNIAMADRRAYGAAGNFPKSAETVDEWLDAIQMGMYKMNFANIAVPDLPALSNSQLKEMVPQDGHRKRMTLAIAALEGLSRDAAAASAASAAPQVKFNSTSSFYIDSTISKPCIDEIIFCVSIVIHDRIEEGEANPAKDAAEGSKLFPFFDVQSKPLFQFADGDGGPTEDTIFHTIKSIYSIAEFSPECLVISLLYIERLCSTTKCALLICNWQPVLLSAMVVAQKVWDDRCLSNADFSVIAASYTLKEVNDLEVKFLQLLQYNVSITASLYASYYFELRTLCEKKNATLNMKPLGADEAKSLEARTAAFETNAKQTRKWQSMSVAEGCARSPAPCPRRSAQPALPPAAAGCRAARAARRC